MLQLDLLATERLIVHHINRRGPDRAYVAPRYGEAPVPLTDGALDMFSKRVVTSLGHNSKGIKVDFRQTGAGSHFQKMADIMRCDEARFVTLSKELADDLSQAQVGFDHAPSKLLIATGVQGNHQRRFAIAVKAEMQDGLGESIHGKETIIQHLTNIFLTEAQRLYKIGFVQQTGGKPKFDAGLYDPEQFIVHLFDHAMTGTEARSAALYFYNDFMGADLSKSDKKLTQDFYEKTRKFFDSRDLEPERRVDLLESLRMELKSNDKQISVPEFAEKHMDGDMRRDYEAHMVRAHFPTHAITKDTEYVASKLKRPHKTRFSSGVTLTVPADRFKELVLIESEREGSTVVTIKGTIESQE